MRFYFFSCNANFRFGSHLLNYTKFTALSLVFGYEGASFHLLNPFYFHLSISFMFMDFYRLLLAGTGLPP